MTTFKLWDCIGTDDPDTGDYVRKRIKRKFPTIDPPSRRVEINEPKVEIIRTMQEAPIGTQACIGNIPVKVRAK